MSEANNKDKLLRVQGPRSRGGCQTCKLRHLKCDEALPVCGRCLRSKRVCRYQSNRNELVGTKFIVYSFPNEPGPFLTIPPVERRALSHFQHRTVRQIGGPFRSELWSSIIPRLIQDDEIVRQAVLALSAFHEQYLDRGSSTLRVSDHALCSYQKARRHIIKLESPESSFDSILCACIIFCACEGLLGNFEEAIQHAMAGMKIIAARKDSSTQGRSILESRDDVLYNLFLALQAQVMEANVDEFQVSYPALEWHMAEMPKRFTSAEDALPHLQILMSRVVRLYQTAEEHHETQPWRPSTVSPALQSEYSDITARFEAWSTAVTQIKGLSQETDRFSHRGYLLLRILSTLLEIDLHVFVHGEATYHDFKETIDGVLSMIEKFLEICSHTDDSILVNDEHSAEPSDNAPLSFTSSPEVIPVLFEIATRTTDYGQRQRATKLMRLSNRREGIWDGCVAAKLAERITELDRQGSATAAKQHGRKFIITDIQFISEQKVLVRFGFKAAQPGSFNSFWVEDIHPGQGSLQSQVLTIT